MDIQLLNALGITDCAIFKRNDELQIQCITPEVSWLKKVVPLTSNNIINLRAVSSIFLKDFLIDTNIVWQNDTAFSLSSGFWTEEHQDECLRLEAVAINNGNGEYFLVLKNVADQFSEKQRTLQAARELLLSHHEIVGQHEYIRKRLDNALLKNKTYEQLVPPIKQAIYHLDTGVVILDKDCNVVLDNNSARQLLLCNDTINSAQRLENLMSNVSVLETFLSTLIEKKSAWQGEIYWHPCDEYNIWLQVTIHPVILNNQLTHWVYLLTDITHIHTKEENILPTTGIDSLTKVANRNFYNNYIQKLIHEKVEFTQFTLDIREFKKINEKLGYNSGDEILRAFAARLQNFVGNSGFVARIGSNEFAVIKRNDTFSNISRLDYANNMRKKLVTTYTSLRGAESNLGINIGIASYPLDGKKAENLMYHADIALQIAKYQGKNIILEYSEELQQQHHEMSLLELELRNAIDKEELCLYLQPIVNLQTGKIVKCEALARWKTENGSDISPEVFIPIAERTELIFPFGEWLIKEACHIVNKLTAADIDIKLAINISGSQVTDLSLLSQIKTILEDQNISATNLSIEITESVFIDNLDTVSVLLSELRSIGVTISIDDFGTGFSSLVYLKKLPINELKIDRSFVSDSENNNDDQAIIQAILGLAKSLNLNIIAEGVETHQQQAFLLEHGCNYGQGYLYDKPMPVEEFIKKYQR